MTARQYLKQAQSLDQRIDAKLSQLQAYKATATKCTSYMTGMPRNPNRGESRLEDIVAKIVDLQTEINAEIDRLVDLKQEISDRISALPEPKEQAVLMMRYIAYKDWAQISADLGYTQRYVYRIHNKAIENFSRLLENQPPHVT